MNGKLVSKVVSCLGLLFVLVVWVPPARATVTTTGDIDPAGIGGVGPSNIVIRQDPWNVLDNLTVGDTSFGTLNVEAGGAVSNSEGYIGKYSGSTGVVTATGSGSQWNNSGELSVGYRGDATLNVEAGGVVSNTHSYIGETSGSTGVVTVTGFGSQWNNSESLYVGDDGTGTLNIETGGVVSNTDSYIGDCPGSTGEVTVTGSGSQWNNSETLYVGDDGTGTLNVTDGGVVTSVDGHIARDVGSMGTVAVRGTGSTWINSGDLHVGQSGRGSVSVTDSGEVQVSGMTQLYANGTINIDGGSMSVVETLQLDVGSNVNLNSGTLSVTSFSGDGSLVWNGGTLEITAPTGLTIGASGPLGALLAIDADQTLNVTNTTAIESGARITALGGFSSDLLKIKSGGQLYAPSGFTNNNEIQLAGGDARITGASLTNGGVISGEGRFVAPINNLPTGEFRSALSERQVFTGEAKSNSFKTWKT